MFDPASDGSGLRTVRHGLVHLDFLPGQFSAASGATERSLALFPLPPDAQRSRTLQMLLPVPLSVPPTLPGL